MAEERFVDQLRSRSFICIGNGNGDRGKMKLSLRYLEDR